MMLKMSDMEYRIEKERRRNNNAIGRPSMGINVPKIFATIQNKFAWLLITTNVHSMTMENVSLFVGLIFGNFCTNCEPTLWTNHNALRASRFLQPELGKCHRYKHLKNYESQQMCRKL